MRPGPIRPGNKVVVVGIADEPEGFNEARADSPGKYRLNHGGPFGRFLLQ